MTLTRFVRRFLRDQHGVTMVEYGLIVALISLIILGGATTVFTAYGEKFNFIANKLG